MKNRLVFATILKLEFAILKRKIVGFFTGKVCVQSYCTKCEKTFKGRSEFFIHRKHNHPELVKNAKMKKDANMRNVGTFMKKGVIRKISFKIKHN